MLWQQGNRAASDDPCLRAAGDCFRKGGRRVRPTLSPIERETSEHAGAVAAWLSAGHSCGSISNATASVCNRVALQPMLCTGSVASLAERSRPLWKRGAREMGPLAQAAVITLRCSSCAQSSVISARREPESTPPCHPVAPLPPCWAGATAAPNLLHTHTHQVYRLRMPSAPFLRNALTPHHPCGDTACLQSAEPPQT